MNHLIAKWGYEFDQKRLQFVVSPDSWCRFDAIKLREKSLKMRENFKKISKYSIIEEGEVTADCVNVLIFQQDFERMVHYGKSAPTTALVKRR